MPLFRTLRALVRLRDYENKGLLLFGALIFLFLSYPFARHWAAEQMLLSAFVTLVMISGIYNNYEAGRRIFVVEILLGLPAIASTWLALYYPENKLIQRIDLVTYLVFFSVNVSVLIIRLMKAQRVTLNTLYTAASGYMLVGMMGAMAAALIENISPHSFEYRFGYQTVSAYFDQYIYYSFITMTTVGFGDFVPVKPASKMLTILLSIFGQLYVAVLIAILIGKYLNEVRGEVRSLEKKIEAETREVQELERKFEQQPPHKPRNLFSRLFQ